MKKGHIWPAEWKTYNDPISGIEVTKLTNYKAHSYHLYFTENGWYDNQQRLLFYSERGNRKNVYSVDMLSGDVRQLTDLPHGANIQACLAPDEKHIFYRTGRRIYSLALDTLEEQLIYEHPADSKFNMGMINPTCDGKYIITCFGEDVSKKLRVDLTNGYVGFWDIWRAKPLSRIARISVADGSVDVVYEEKAWIGHINTSPTQANMITFCHEGPWHKVDQRIWGLDLQRGDAWQIRPREEEEEKVGHEYWFEDGETVGYHGFREDGTAFFGKIKHDNSEKEEVEFPYSTWHCHSHQFSRVAVDGKGPVRTMTVWERDGDRFDGPRILCDLQCSFHSQQLHAHPRFSPDGQKLLFMSDPKPDGYGNVYVAHLPHDFKQLPEAPYGKKNNA